MLRRLFPISPDNNPLTENLYYDDESGESAPAPPVDEFLLLDAGDFLLMNGTNFLLLGM